VLAVAHGGGPLTVYDSSAPPPPPRQVPNVQQALLDLRKQVRAELDGVVIGAKEAST
jgi:hypothetical protein